MDTSRGRSPSAGSHIRRPSASPHAPYHNASGLGLDQSLSPDPTTTSFTQATTAGQSFDAAQFLTTTQSPQFPPPTALADQTYLQTSQGLSQRRSPSPQFGPQGNTLAPDPLDIGSNGSNVGYSSYYSDSGLNQSQAIDPSFLSNTLDPQLLDSQPQNQSVNPSDLMNQMATAHPHSPTPPHLLPGMNQQSPSPHASPNMSQGAFPSPSHSRHASLDPSAAYGQGNEWANMAPFRGHRRAPSETYSDVSSAHASPYMGNHDSFDHDNPSPLLNAQQDPSLFQEVMGIGQFNLNDNQSHISPGHSPHISPRLLPQQQALPQFQPGSFGLDPNFNNQFGQQGMGAYQGQGQEPFPSINQGPGPEFGQADTMSPPEINIDFAPPSRQASFDPPKPEHQTDALSPPDRCELPKCLFKVQSDSVQLAAGTGYAPSPIRLAALALAPLRLVWTSWKPTVHYLPVPQSLARHRPLPSHPVVPPLQACPIAITSSTSQIHQGPPTSQAMARMRSARKSILRHSSVLSARSASLAPTISGLICARIQTSVRSCAVCAAKHLRASMIVSGMKAFTRERRSSSAVACSKMRTIGVAAGGLLVPML